MIPFKTLKPLLLSLLLITVAGLAPTLAGPSPDNRPVPLTPTAQTYYVANDGDDDDDGLTPGTAWQTIDHVNDQTFQPGDTILFRRGDTWRETLYVTHSGTPAAWITYGAYGTGANPRILGSAQATGWTEVATNVWRSSTLVDNPYQGGYSYGEVFFEELDGTYSWGQQQDYDATFTHLTDEYDWTWHADTLYIYAPSDPDERYAAVEVPQRDSCVRLPNVDGSYVLPEDYVEYVAFDHLTLMYAMRHGFYAGYNEVEAHGLRITNCHIGCIGVRGGSSAYGIAAWHSDMLIQNNTIHDCGRRGISLNTYTSYTPGLTVSDITIDSNHFYNGYHTTSVDNSSLAGLGHTFTHVTITNNLIDDTGRWDEAINAGCVSSSCTSNSLYISASAGNTYTDYDIYNNVILGSTSRAILLVDMEDVHVYHNTVYASHPGARPYALVIFNDVAGIDLRNNLIYGTLSYDGGANDARCVMDQGSAASFAIRDYNLYHQEDPAQPFTGSQYGVGGWDTFIPEWDTWRAASGFETHSPRPQDPLLMDPGNGDVSLQAGSPAVDAGVLIPGINDDYQGAAPDLGALEFSPALTLHGAPADQAIHLSWTVNVTLPATTTWHIDYYTSTTHILSDTNILSPTHSHLITNLTNYYFYTVTLNALLDTTAFLSDTVRVMPTDELVYMPVVMRGE